MINFFITLKIIALEILLNEKFVLCVIDAFSSIKTSECWKIAGTDFTMELEGCTESPLGEIKDEQNFIV